MHCASLSWVCDDLVATSRLEVLESVCQAVGQSSSLKHFAVIGTPENLCNLNTAADYLQM